MKYRYHQAAKVDTISLCDGFLLSAIIKELAEKGVTDLSKVSIMMDSDSSCRCNAQESGDYCYCDPAYTDVRLEWKIVHEKES